MTPMQIPRYRVTVTDQMRSSVDRALLLGQLATGDATAEFERKLAQITGYEYNVATSSGFAALHLAIEACTRCSDREYILIPACSTCFAVPNAVLAARKKIRLYDVDPATLGPSVDSMLDNMRQDLAAIVLISHFGLLINPEILPSNPGCPVIEDCAQSLLSRCASESRPYFDISTFSFYPTKGVCAIDGGAASSNSTEMGAFLRQTVYYDKQTFLDGIRRFNYRMHNVDAAFGAQAIKSLPAILKRRSEIQRQYDEIFRAWRDKVTLLHHEGQPGTVPQKYVVMLNDAALTDRFVAGMNNAGIAAINELVCFFRSEEASRYPNASSARKRLVLIPFYEALSESEVSYACETADRVLAAL